MGQPRAERSGPEEAGGFFEDGSQRGLAGAKQSANHAPYIVFSTACHDQFAWETPGSEGKPVGSLTYSLARGVSDLGPGATYRTLYERVGWLMARRVVNEPQVEGTVDALIFNGAFVAQRPYFVVKSVEESRKSITLAAGVILGVLKGCTVELHSEATREPTDETRIATGKVVRNSLSHSTVELDRPIYRSKRYRAFATTCAYGAVRVRSQLAPSPPGS